ncbi:MAG: protein-disulfide reductase DsbD domain-containing protein, partial [Verrucomicrobiota bacterium]
MISRSVIPTLSFILLAMAVTHGDRSVVAAPLSEPGLKELKFITESKYIEPGSTITVGLRIVPDEGHHTYWRGPGIVGVATVIEWDLPEGFEAGPIQWPAPEKVDMVGITANGYKGDTILLTEIKIPEDLPRGAFHLHAKIAWMSCATSCNPGVTKRTIGFLHDPDEKPQTRSAMKLLFDSVRKEMPEPAPEEWVHTVSLPDKETIKLKVSVPGIDRSWAKGLEFFCDDMQVDSN